MKCVFCFPFSIVDLYSSSCFSYCQSVSFGTWSTPPLVLFVRLSNLLCLPLKKAWVTLLLLLSFKIT